MVIKFGAPLELLRSYEEERKPVALSVVETSGALVRSTKYSKDGTHAKDYVDIVERRAGYVTGMGVRYGDEGIVGTRLFDFEVWDSREKARIYSKLDYARYTLLVFGDRELDPKLPPFVKLIQIRPTPGTPGLSSEDCPYADQVILVRPDSYIASCSRRDEFVPEKLPI